VGVGGCTVNGAPSPPIVKKPCSCKINFNGQMRQVLYTPWHSYPNWSPKPWGCWPQNLGSLSWKESANQDSGQRASKTSYQEVIDNCAAIKTKGGCRKPKPTSKIGSHYNQDKRWYEAYCQWLNEFGYEA
jgi:hypothetical protein